MSATDKQIALMRDIRMKGAINALLYSPHRAEGPGLREAGFIGGIGDSTALTGMGMDEVLQADLRLRAALSTTPQDTPDRHGMAGGE